MNGILCMNKPQGFTSFDVIGKLRGILKMKRLGHSGTLDPMATGVLPVFIGSATRACDILPDNSKSYDAGFKLGITTDTQDITGTVTAEKDAFGITFEMLENTANHFKGDIMQIPPMYSAVSVNGHRLYDLARKGIEVERKPRQIHIDDIVFKSFNEKSCTGVVSIFCGKGTYIRTIINDIGDMLGCGAVMTSLVRTSSSGFTLNDCFDFDTVEKYRDEDRLEEIIIPIERAFETLPELILNEQQTVKYKNGVKLPLDSLSGILSDKEQYRLFGYDRVFIGTADADRNNGILRIGKNLATS